MERGMRVNVLLEIHISCCWRHTVHLPRRVLLVCFFVPNVLKRGMRLGYVTCDRANGVII